MLLLNESNRCKCGGLEHNMQMHYTIYTYIPTYYYTCILYYIIRHQIRFTCVILCAHRILHMYTYVLRVVPIIIIPSSSSSNYNGVIHEHTRGGRQCVIIHNASEVNFKRKPFRIAQILRLPTYQSRSSHRTRYARAYIIIKRNNYLKYYYKTRGHNIMRRIIMEHLHVRQSL